MTVFKKEVVALIGDIVRKLGLETSLIRESVSLYEDSVKTAALATKRVRDRTMALACVYIAMRLHSKQPVKQDLFAWNFNTSTASIRKAYVLICDVMGIDRHVIIGDKFSKGGAHPDGKADSP
jgi:transcription initiation factor TFIIIB Brf1 subunit/transcription initiation factor TFIIB